MAPKPLSISVAVAKGLMLTQSEKDGLEEAFRTDVVQVLSASRPHDPAPFPEVNISGGGRGQTTAYAKKPGSSSAKKASSKGKKAASKGKKK